MADSPVVGYADALFSVAEAEGNISAVEDELFGFSQTLQTQKFQCQNVFKSLKTY